MQKKIILEKISIIIEKPENYNQEDLAETSDKDGRQNMKYLVLDGQQRLTALNIALKGKIITKKKNQEELYMHINL